jgi:hypothetical protein
LIQYERRGVRYGYNKNLLFAEPQDGVCTALVPVNHIVYAMAITAASEAVTAVAGAAESWKCVGEEVVTTTGARAKSGADREC